MRSLSSDARFARPVSLAHLRSPTAAQSGTQKSLSSRNGRLASSGRWRFEIRCRVLPFSEAMRNDSAAVGTLGAADLFTREPQQRFGVIESLSVGKGSSAMKWILVVLIGGVTPVPTDLIFEKLSDCLVAEEQLRKTYAEAFEALSQQSSASLDRFERRRGRDYYRMRELEAKRVSNSGTCIPHSGTNQPITSLNNERPVSAPAPTPGAPAR